MSSNYKVISKRWVTLSKCQYPLKHRQPHFSEGRKCTFTIQVAFRSSGTGNECFDLRWSKVLLRYYLFATLQLVTYFPHFNLLSHKKWSTNELLAEGNSYRTANQALPSLEKTSFNEHTQWSILLLTLHTNGIQILTSFPPFSVLKPLKLFAPPWKTT